MTPAAPTAPLPAPLAPAELSRVAQDLQIRKVQVEAVVQLLDEGNTIPFITRYRKERTGGLNEVLLRHIQDRVAQLRHLADRKQTILKAIEAQGKLTEELKASILAAEHSRRLEDLYLPYKIKKKTLASEAREKGLEPLAGAIWVRDPVAANLAEIAAGVVNPEKGLNSADEVLAGVGHILAELIAETADLRSGMRRFLWETARLVVTRNEKLPDGKGLEYKDYFQFTEGVMRVPPHRILALNRGERENALSVKLEFDPEVARRIAIDAFPQLTDHPHKEFLHKVVEDAVTRLLLPSLEREIRRELTEVAQRHAVEVFARNLRGLLMQPPLRGRRVLAVDPGFRTGCKLAALDETGALLEDGVIFPHQPQKKIAEARQLLRRLICVHQTSVIAIGNGTACRETEELVASLIAEFDAIRRGEAPAVAPVPSSPPAVVIAEPMPPAEPTPGEPAAVDAAAEPIAVPEPHPSLGAAEVTIAAPATEQPPPLPPPLPLPDPPADLAYVIVNEAGASDYSASAAGREEFPTRDASLRGTVSIGRRLQDPLSELVKIDPQHVGVGLYQHDVHGKHLKGSLEAVIESCVNHVGVDLNTASSALLRHVSGFNQLVARELVDFRSRHGAFRRREQLAEVPSIGVTRFTQAAGFLKIADGEEPLDATWIHPESYPLARQILQDLGHAPGELKDPARLEEIRTKLKTVSAEEIAGRLDAGVPTVADILDALARPGRDPREDLPPPIFRRDVLKLEDLQPAMELKGTVLNVVDFGAFVDIGLKDSGLVHISQLANRYIKNPHEVVTVGDVVTVWVLAVDGERRRVSLTMIPPGTPRRPPERAARDQRAGARPGDRPRPDRPQRPGDRRRGPQRPGDAPDGAPSEGSPPPARQLRVERKPRPPKPLPTLTREKREGKAYLTTLGELEAFFKAREGGNQPPPPPPG